MKKFSFLALSLLATAFVGCKEDEKEIDNPVVITPEVTLEAGETTETTIAFTVTSKDAEAAAYLVFEGETVPAAEDIFANGTAVEVNKAVEVTVEELNAETTYGVIAAARNGEQVKVADAIELTTLKAGEPDNPDGPKDEIKITRVEGGLNNYQSYRLWVHLSNQAMLYFDVACPDSEHNILPAHEYPVVYMGDPEAEIETEYEYYVHGDGSSYQLGYDQYAVRSGKLTVAHHETEGYVLDIDIVLNDDEQTALKLAFEGVIPASEIGGDFRNPPYVEPEKETIEVTITDLGAAYGNPGESWYFWIDTADDDAYSAFLMLEFPMVTDGVLPAATYTYAKDYSAYREERTDENGYPYTAVKDGEYHIMCASKMDSHLVVKADESYVALVEGSTLTVEHDTANKAYILTLNLVGENGDIVTSTYTATSIRKQWDWEGSNEFKFPGEGGAASGYDWEYMNGRVYNMGNFALLGRTIDQTTEFFFDMYCPTQSQKVLPAATYVVADEGEYIVHPYSYVKLDGMTQAEYLQGGNVVVEHVNGVYKVTCDVTTTSGANFAFVYEGRIEDGVGEGFLNPGEGTDEPGGDDPVANNCVVKGNCGSNSGAFAFFVEDKEVAYLPIYFPSSIVGVVPEGEYAFATEGEYYARYDWAAINNKAMTADGSLVVKHTNNGYDIALHCFDTDGNEYNYNYVGIVEPYSQRDNISNPPIPYDESTYNVAFDTMKGRYSSNEFSLTGTTAEGLEFGFTLKAEGLGFDGVLPEGEYTIGGTDYVASYVSSIDTTNEEAMSINYTEGKVTVAHLAEGYSITFNAKNVLKTTYVATFEGVVATDPNGQYPFENPGVVIPAVFDVTFTDVTYAGVVEDDYGTQTRDWNFTNEEGSTFTLRLDPVFTENGLVEGTYPITSMAYWMSYEAGKQYASDNMPLTVAGSGQERPFYVSGGAVKIAKDGDNYTVTWDGYIYFYNIGNIENGNQKVKISYTGAMPME